MTKASTPRCAHWRQAVPAGLSGAARDWVVQTDSLTRALQACGQFRVHCLHQGLAPVHADEWRALGLTRPGQVWQREVLLWLNDQPVVFAHTVVPLHHTAYDWPFFSELGHQSLGSALFSDPLIQRQALYFSHLLGKHPLLQKAQHALSTPLNSGKLTLASSGPQAQFAHTGCYARRSVFTRRQARMLVSEVFLPALFTAVSQPLLASR
ncbi:chorismate--pyruvate lyase family protein [Parvibium lacunae]|uniref:Probable chorismate pyruvate-lyase n=1 Tax=Parvibium lacunae TaxID=1888893 RepID=A0A368KZI8_9BURK|nr:chorismate lyase [Parvibium lacunae]RCS56723.1 chorismate lyase [Parvibium lacunae]